MFAFGQLYIVCPCRLFTYIGRATNNRGGTMSVEYWTTTWPR